MKTNGKEWDSVDPPIIIKFENPDEEVVGFFHSIGTVWGPHGSFGVLLLSAKQGVVSLSGARLMALVSAAGTLTPQDRIRVSYKGTEMNVKLFDLQVQRG